MPGRALRGPARCLRRRRAHDLPRLLGRCAERPDRRLHKALPVRPRAEIRLDDERAARALHIGDPGRAPYRRPDAGLRSRHPRQHGVDGSLHRVQDHELGLVSGRHQEGRVLVSAPARALRHRVEHRPRQRGRRQRSCRTGRASSTRAGRGERWSSIRHRAAASSMRRSMPGTRCTVRASSSRSAHRSRASSPASTMRRPRSPRATWR